MAYFMLCIFYHNKNKGSDYTEDKERKKSREEGGEGERERGRKERKRERKQRKGE